MKLLRRTRAQALAGRLLGSVVALSILTLPVSPAVAGQIVVMHQMEPTPHEAVDGVTLGQIRETLLDLLRGKGWVPYPRTSGVIEADRSLNGNKHRMTIAVVFDDRNYVIRYVDSENLNFSDESCRDPNPPSSPFDFKPAARRLRERTGPCNTRLIHPTYNRSVQDLEYTALHAIRFLDPPRGDGDTPEPWSQSTEEETAKLEALQRNGILTADELETQLRLVAGSGQAAEAPAPETAPSAGHEDTSAPPPTAVRGGSESD